MTPPIFGKRKSGKAVPQDIIKSPSQIAFEASIPPPISPAAVPRPSRFRRLFSKRATTLPVDHVIPPSTTVKPVVSLDLRADEHHISHDHRPDPPHHAPTPAIAPAPAAAATAAAAAPNLFRRAAQRREEQAQQRVHDNLYDPTPVPQHIPPTKGYTVPLPIGARPASVIVPRPLETVPKYTPAQNIIVREPEEISFPIPMPPHPDPFRPVVHQPYISRNHRSAWGALDDEDELGGAFPDSPEHEQILTPYSYDYPDSRLTVGSAPKRTTVVITRQDHLNSMKADLGDAAVVLETVIDDIGAKLATTHSANPSRAPSMVSTHGPQQHRPPHLSFKHRRHTIGTNTRGRSLSPPKSPASVFRDDHQQQQQEVRSRNLVDHHLDGWLHGSEAHRMHVHGLLANPHGHKYTLSWDEYNELRRLRGGRTVVRAPKVVRRRSQTRSRDCFGQPFPRPSHSEAPAAELPPTSRATSFVAGDDDTTHEERLRRWVAAAPGVPQVIPVVPQQRARSPSRSPSPPTSRSPSPQQPLIPPSAVPFPSGSRAPSVARSTISRRGTAPHPGGFAPSPLGPPGAPSASALSSVGNANNSPAMIPRPNSRNSVLSYISATAPLDELALHSLRDADPDDDSGLLPSGFKPRRFPVLKDSVYAESTNSNRSSLNSRAQSSVRSRGRSRSRSRSDVSSGSMRSRASGGRPSGGLAGGGGGGGGGGSIRRGRSRSPHPIGNGSGNFATNDRQPSHSPNPPKPNLPPPLQLLGSPHSGPVTITVVSPSVASVHSGGGGEGALVEKNVEKKNSKPPSVRSVKAG